MITAESSPEIEKLKARKHKTEIIHEFLEWASHKHGLELGGYHGEKLWGGGKQFVPFIGSQDNLLAEFIGVDLKKVEKEKRKILAHLRENIT